jgi:hydroxypyruvate reductase
MSAATDAQLAQQMRETARQIFLSSLRETSIENAFRRHVNLDRRVLRVGEDLYDLSDNRPILVVSIGKAAYSMLDCLCEQLGPRATGIAVGPTEPARHQKGFQYFRGGHPLPDADSVRAATTILETMRKLPRGGLVIYLLSGGGSALAEKPISNRISLDDLVAIYKTLVHSGANIVEINVLRKHLSALKGGRLARAAAPGQQVSILISDVPDNALDALASGPTMPDSSTITDCYSIAENHGLLPHFPSSVQELFQEKNLEETPKPGDPAFANSRWWNILSNAQIRDLAAAAAARAGFAVTIDVACDDWDYAAAADYLLTKLHELRKGVSRICLVSGGEVTVRVENGGTGGRNQQFALHCAQKIAGESVIVLSTGTDGIDGNSPAAGAVVDGTTAERARAKQLDMASALSRFDAYPFFQSVGDAIVTGPTGNNIRDLRLLMAY